MDGRQVEGAGPAVPSRPPPLGPYEGCFSLPPPPPVAIQLDTFQQAVVDWRRGEAVVAAAAGSGKTTCAVARILALLREGIIPESVLLLAYNRAAAETVRERLAAVIGKQAAGRVNVYTFHAWCYALLRHWYPADERLAAGRILGTPGGTHPAKIAGPLIDALGLTDALHWRVGIADWDRCSEALVDLEARDGDAQAAVALGLVEAVEEYRPKDVPGLLPRLTFLRAWAERKKAERVIEFSDMLGEVARAVTRHPEALAYLSTLYAHVMVDEAQDVSRARAAIAAHLGAGAASLLWIGDARQAIYAFAGADPAILLERASATTVLPLPRNRRSSQRVVEQANAVAAGRSWNLGGAALPGETARHGDPVQVWLSASEGEEGASVVEDVQRRVAAGAPLLTPHGTPTYCALARTNAMLVDLESAFVAREVPVQVAGCPGGIWGSSLGRDLLAYLEAVSGVPTWGLLDVMNRPKRFARRADVRQVIEAAQAREKAGEPAGLAAALIAEGGTTARLGRDLSRAGRLDWPTRVDLCVSWLGGDEEEDDLKGGDQDRRAAFLALGALARRLDSLAGIYAYKREQAKRESDGAVLLSTIHRAKGQEWPVVYVCGVRAEKFPHGRCESEEEERRLLYVAITRARDTLVLSSGGKPSPFLVDLGLAPSP